MSRTTAELTFTVPLSLTAHRTAEKFHRHQSNPRKAKQVYLNTLAVYAVNFYLQCLEFETELENSDSWNKMMQTLLDVADLEVKNLGKLECRPVFPASEVVDIPAEVWEDRIGYVAVEINQSLQKAKLLGFVKTAATEKLPLNQLLSLEDLPAHLREVKLLQKSSTSESLETREPTNLIDRGLVNLKQWFEAIFEETWQPVEWVLDNSYRTAIRPSNPQRQPSENSVSRAKAIDLGMQLAGYRVALVVRLTPTDTEEVDVRLRLYPVSASYLPGNMKLRVLDESGTVCMETRSRSADNWIQLEFGARSGEQFSVTIALEDVIITEKFVV